MCNVGKVEEVREVIEKTELMGELEKLDFEDIAVYRELFEGTMVD
jgi:hypothetical protein